MKVFSVPETDLSVSSQAIRLPNFVEAAHTPAARPAGSVTPAPTSDVSFAVIYRAHFAFVWRSLRALGLSTASLDDAVQDVFIVVHRQLGGFDHRASLRSWVFAIAYNVASNYRRREHRKGGLALLDPEMPSNHPDPESQLHRAQAWAFLSQFLDTLDDAKRAVFVLTQLEGLSATEVADALSIPVNTVYTRLHHARNALRDALAANQSGGSQ